MSARRHSAERGFRECLGPLAGVLADEALTDLHRNADGSIHLLRYGADPEPSALRVSDAEAYAIIRLAADLADSVVTENAPLIRSTLPDGSRFQGVVPPVSSAPLFSIRRHRARRLTLDHYAVSGILTPGQRDRIRAAIDRRANILITGDTGVGKTTLLNAMLTEPAVAACRLFVAEDTREIQADGGDVVQLRTSDTVSLRDLVVTALRLRPDRIVIGETRSGDTAIEMLKAWTTGDRGGFSTLHADSAEGFVIRLRTLLQEVVAGGVDALIAHGVDLVVHLAATRSGPRCTGLARVGWRDGLWVEVEAPGSEPSSADPSLPVPAIPVPAIPGSPVASPPVASQPVELPPVGLTPVPAPPVASPLAASPPIASPSLTELSGPGPCGPGPSLAEPVTQEVAR